MPEFKAKSVALSAVVAAMYAGLTLLLQPISFGTLQIRFAEALALLPFLMPEGVIGVTVGCFIANCFSPFGIYDALVGTGCTLVAAVLTYKIKNKRLSALPPILINSCVLPLMWKLLGSTEAYYISFLSLLTSQSVVLYALGLPLITIIAKRMPWLLDEKKFAEPPSDET